MSLCAPFLNGLYSQAAAINILLGRSPITPDLET